MSSTEASLTPGSFRHIALTFYPPGIYAIPFIALGIVVWFLLTGPYTAPLLLSTTGIAGYLLLPVLAGVTIGGYGVLGAIRAMLTAHRLHFLPLTMDFTEEEPTLTIPFVGQLENAPLNIPGLTMPIVKTVKVPDNGGETTKEQTILPVTSLGLYVFQAPVYIPQPIQIPRFWQKPEQPVDKMFFISQWDLTTVNRKFPAWVGYKRLLTIAANVLPMYVSLIRAKLYVQKNKPVPVWWISGCKGSVREAQALTKMRYLTHEQYMQIETAIGEQIAYEERFKRESVEAENNVLKQQTPNLQWSVDTLYNQRRTWETEGLDTTQPGQFRKWLSSKWGVVTLISIVIIALIVMGIVLSFVKHP